MEILRELAHEDDRVLEEPPPGVVFNQFVFAHLLTTLASLLGPRGYRAIVADSLL